MAFWTTLLIIHGLPWTPERRGPAVYWYGWMLTSLIGAVALGWIARAVSEPWVQRVILFGCVGAVRLSDALHARALYLGARIRGMRTGSSVLLLQTLAEFSSVAIRKAGIRVDEVRRSTRGERCYLYKALRMTIFLDAVKKHRLALWDAMLWAAA